MRRTFRYRLKPNAQQCMALRAVLTLCCQLYNAALEQRIWAWRQRKTNISRYDQCKDLTDLRAADPLFGAVSLVALRSALSRLERAYQAFFRRVKRGEKPGFPRFRSRDRYDSFSIGRVKLQDRHVRVPNLGLVRVGLHRPLTGEVRETTIRFDGRRWWVCFSVELPDVKPMPIEAARLRSAGVDLGLKHYATVTELSGLQSYTIDNPRYFRKGKEQLADRQRRLQTKTSGSRARWMARLLVREAHRHIQNQRIDFARKLSAFLFRRYDCVYYEALDIKGLIAKDNGSVAIRQSISDAGWGLFIRSLQLKAEDAGVWAVPVEARGTTQECSSCGTICPKKLWDRQHECHSCGFTEDRDVNASVNVLRRGQRLTSEVEAFVL